METLGIYVQVPFCASKCTFCNFSSRVARAASYDAYVRAIEREAALIGSRCGTARLREDLPLLPVDTIYVGGGTPSLLGAEKLDRIFLALRENFDLREVKETTLEMTPGSADAGLLAALATFGVNRLSIGAQSFDDRELRPTGRLHSAADTVGQMRAARAAGFANLNLDLIAGLPYQTMPSWRRTLETLASLEPEHVSVYLFEADEKSRLGRDVLRGDRRGAASFVPDDEWMANAYEFACEFLAGRGYTHYEISNFSRPGFESAHNQRYWRRQPYVGLGAGAHSFDGARRWANEIEPVHYEARLEQGDLPVSETLDIDAASEMEEFFFLGLRQQEGVSLDEARVRWGSPPLSGWAVAAARLKEQGLLREAGGRLQLAPQAYLVSNEVFLEFIR